ncbi:nodulation protein T [Methyloglobulus morosus KoM1]|uniref:Nodulation protein T n=1 Tax=Methyloglobulus morosus KoM1 TaxID=1116472 RepID=V5BLY1_9GAMM|nr:efflux transporter outer membrane subunit [Methyloglobulus morosus]ESS68814.1 nodulation protein T [Methyloglobulus morosus KoM1]
MIRYVFASCFIGLVSACAVGPDYHAPVVPVPKQWHESSVTAKQAQSDQWWQTFNDQELNQLITEAIAANLDLKQALWRVTDAREQRIATIAAGLPSISARNTASRRLNNSSSPSQSGGATSGGGFGVGNQAINIFQLGFDAQWELDFFGGVRRAIEAADATVESEAENSRDVLVILLGDVARNYIELRSNQQLADITRKNLAAQRETQMLTDIRQQSGLASMLEVTQAQAQADTTEAQLPNYEALVKQSIHALSVLLGREPGSLALRLGRQTTLPTVTEQVIPDLPSDLLKRRPDIRRAERQLAVANASVGVATAELYPKVNLAAFLGLQNMKITDFTPLGKSWSAASTLTMPIFNWGKLNANIKSKKALFEQAFLTYQSTVLTAFQEVEDTLIAYRKEQERQQALAKAVVANQLAVQLANERYGKGLTGFIDVLQTQLALYQSESLLVTSNAKVSSNLVALYKALGGGWQTESKVSNATLKVQKF